MYMAMCIRRLALFPSGLTSWIFIASYTHKRPLCGHCASPLQKPSQSVCVFDLTSWGFMVSYTHKRPLRGHFAPPLQKPSQSVCVFDLTSWGFMVK